MPLLRTITLGCKVNQYETEYVRHCLESIGYHTVEQGDTDAGEPSPDLILVNTCTVTAESDSKCRKLIRRAAREHPDARLIVIGCLATHAAERIAAIEGVDRVLADRAELPELLADLGVTHLPSGIDRFAQRSRAFVKIQDGCVAGCAYCIIPKVRSKLSSRPIETVEDEARRLIDAGYRELVLTGIHLGYYGRGYPDDSPTADLAAGLSPGESLLPELLARLVQLDGEFRLRISSIEATEATDRLLDVMAAAADRICPHLHLSMQSGSDPVLKGMRRRQSAEVFERCCDRVRERLELPALTTDIIVGFPGETDEDHETTCRAVERIGFAKVHAFRFSPREGTPAATMAGQITKQVKRERLAELEQRAEATRRAYYDTLLGRREQFMVESTGDASPDLLTIGGSETNVTLRGTSARYAMIETTGPADLVGRLATAALDHQTDPGVLQGRLN